MTRKGAPPFQALQHRAAHPNHVVVFYAFDLLHLDGRDLESRPLHERRALLPQVLGDSGILQSIELPGSAQDVIDAVRRLGLEEVIAKRRDSPYIPADRGAVWLKVKLARQQEFVIGGYRPGPYGVDAILVGYYDRRTLRFGGNVRGGFAPRLRCEVFEVLNPIETSVCPFVDLPNSKTSHWG